MNNDLISREALKKHKITTTIYNGIEPENIEVVPVATIDNAPTVEPTFGLFKEMLCTECDKKSNGEWIEHYDSSDGFTWLTCSRCMFKAYEDDYNFCPNCGAKMTKEAEND